MLSRYKYFDSIAVQFESWMNPFDLMSRLAWFSFQLDSYDLKDMQVLDVGSGLGHFSRLIAERGGRPILLDIASKLLKSSKSETLNVVQGSTLELPFPDNTFPFVISSECIEHTSDPLKAIREMIRVLDRGGILVLSTPNRCWKWSLSVANFFGIRKFAGIENWPRRHEVKQTLINSNLDVIAEHGLFLLPFQIRFLWPFLRWSNRKGQFLKRFMINQCWVARKE